MKSAEKAKIQHDAEHGASPEREGKVAKWIESKSARVPSDTFLWAAGASITGSLVLQMMGREKQSLFVGQWAPVFLILGMYNKFVKRLGSESE